MCIRDSCRDLDADAQGPLLAHVDADVQRANHVAGSILERVVLGQILSAEQRCIPDVGLTLQQPRITRVRAAQKGAEGSLAVLLPYRSGNSDKVFAAPGEDRRRDACLRGKSIQHRAIEIEVDRTASQYGRR